MVAIGPQGRTGSSDTAQPVTEQPRSRAEDARRCAEPAPPFPLSAPFGRAEDPLVQRVLDSRRDRPRAPVQAVHGALRGVHPALARQLASPRIQPAVLGLELPAELAVAAPVAAELGARMAAVLVRDAVDAHTATSVLE